MLASNLIESLPEEMGRLTRLKTLALAATNQLASRFHRISPGFDDAERVRVRADDVTHHSLRLRVAHGGEVLEERVARVERARRASPIAATGRNRSELVPLTVVPASVGRLKRLKMLNIENNVGVHTIPSDVFKSCERSRSSSRTEPP